MPSDALTYDQIVTLCSLLVAAAGLIVGYLRGRKTEDQRQQRTDDKLDHIGVTVSEVRDDVKDMSSKLDSHSVQLARTDATLDDHDRRITALERRCETHMGGGA